MFIYLFLFDAYLLDGSLLPALDAGNADEVSFLLTITKYIYIYIDVFF